MAFDAVTEEDQERMTPDEYTVRPSDPPEGLSTIPRLPVTSRSAEVPRYQALASG